MKYIKTYTVVRLDYQILEQLKNTNEVLKTITSELEELSEKDKNYKDIADDAWRASATLDNFLDAYQCEVARS